ncbi:MAG: single-stranded-DNA-specific exonuclease RecJ, partial [Lachnospiraceae bacterium]|nr:single-stranded-DNA-specific exonuclease RecJ [Lachnospiraceae bacterium]
MKKEQRWFIKQKKVDFLSIAERLGVDPLIVRLMTNRDIEPEDMGSYLHPVREDLHDPHLLHDGQKTAEYLADAIHRGKKIRVIGDYDIDG